MPRYASFDGDSGFIGISKDLETPLPAGAHTFSFHWAPDTRWNANIQCNVNFMFIVGGSPAAFASLQLTGSPQPYEYKKEEFAITLPGPATSFNMEIACSNAANGLKLLFDGFYAGETCTETPTGPGSGGPDPGSGDPGTGNPGTGTQNPPTCEPNFITDMGLESGARKWTSDDAVLTYETQTSAQANAPHANQGNAYM